MNDWMLERFLLGELPPEQRRAVEAQLATDGALRARLDALRSSDAQLRARFPAGEVKREVERRRARSEARTPRPRAWVAVPTLALATVLAVILWPSVPSGDVVRTKGATRLLAYRQLEEQVELLEASAVLRAGDAVQLRYRLDGRTRHGVVLSIDGRGTITRHLVTENGTSEPLSPKGEVSLPRGYQLDDAPGFERFFLVTRDAPFAAAPVLEAAAELVRSGRARDGQLPLPAGFDVQDLLLRKESR